MRARRRLPTAPEALAVILLTMVAEAHAEPLDAAALDYALQCQGCHLADGRGGGDIPSLHGIGRVLAAEGGREYLARVPGVSNASIDDARLAALLTWVLERWSRAALPADFVPYSEAEIAPLRTPLADPAAARAKLLPGP